MAVADLCAKNLRAMSLCISSGSHLNELQFCEETLHNTNRQQQEPEEAPHAHSMDWHVLHNRQDESKASQHLQDSL